MEDSEIVKGYFDIRIKELRRNLIFITVLILALFLALTSCHKDYSVKPAPFEINDKVRLDGIDLRKSFDPYDCCVCPCTITGKYLIADQRYWWFNLKDLNDSTVTHVDNEQLKRMDLNYYSYGIKYSKSIPIIKLMVDTARVDKNLKRGDLEKIISIGNAAINKLSRP